MATAPALCCPPPGPGLRPHPTPSTREPCDLTPQVQWDECTQDFHAAQITRVVDATNAVEEAVAAVEAAVQAQRDVERNVLHEGAVTFIRTTTYDGATGTAVSAVDTLLDGVTPYVVLNPLSVLAGPAPIIPPDYEITSNAESTSNSLILSLWNTNTAPPTLIGRFDSVTGLAWAGLESNLRVPTYGIQLQMSAGFGTLYDILNRDYNYYNFIYDVDGNITSVTRVDPLNAIPQTKTFTYTLGKLTAVTAWI